MQETIFDKIVRGEVPSYKVWENDDYLAFLTPFPNTPGVTVVIPKRNPGDYIFSIDLEVYIGLMKAVKTVANLLEDALEVKRVAMVFEGTGVAHVHAKLYPLYGALADETDVWASSPDFTDTYRGYITTHEGPEMDAEALKAMQQRIQAQSKTD